MERHTITLHSDAYQKLVKFGRFGESFSDVINRLVDTVEKKERK